MKTCLCQGTLLIQSQLAQCKLLLPSLGKLLWTSFRAVCYCLLYLTILHTTCIQYILLIIIVYSLQLVYKKSQHLSKHHSQSNFTLSLPIKLHRESRIKDILCHKSDLTWQDKPDQQRPFCQFGIGIESISNKIASANVRFKQTKTVWCLSVSIWRRSTVYVVDNK